MEENNKTSWSSFFTGFLTCMVLIAVLFTTCKFFGYNPFSYSKFSEELSIKASGLESVIEKDFWKSDVSKKKMIDGALKGMVSSLGDEYSEYFTSDEYKQFLDHVDGKYVGIGISIAVDKKTKLITIMEVNEDSPAKKAGLKAGDKILKVDGKDLTNADLNECTNIMKKEAGQSLSILVSRTENKKVVEKNFVITIDKIETKTSRETLLDGKIGYIYLDSFTGASTQQFKKSLETLDKKGAKALIIDVRENHGGALEAAVGISDRLLPAGTILTEQYRNRDNKVYKSTDKEHYDKPIAVLINENSASASEVLAGALQDRKRAILVGTKSFGKGIVQTIFTLNKKNAAMEGVKLTTGEYLLPSGRSIHKKGLTPDIEVKYSGKSMILASHDDNVLNEAIKQIKKKIINK